MGKYSAGLGFDLVAADLSRPSSAASIPFSYYGGTLSRQDSSMSTHHSNIDSSYSTEPNFDDFDDFDDDERAEASSTMFARRPVPITHDSFSSTHSLHAKTSSKALNKHLRNLNGTWSLSKALSSGVPPALELQGFNSASRKAIIASPMSLWISQSHYPSQIFAKETTTTSSPTRTERWYPPHNGSWSEWWTTSSTGMGGGYISTKSRCKWTKGSEIEHGEEVRFLTEGLSMSGEYLMAEIECAEMGWKAKQIWFVDRGRLVRRVVTLGDGDRRAETSLVYNFAG